MRTVQFKVHFCGMSEELYAEHCMIYKPCRSLVREYAWEELSKNAIVHISDLICHIKSDHEIAEQLGDWGRDSLNVHTVFLKDSSYLLGLQKDKRIESVFEDLQTETLRMRFFVVGGASLHCEGGYLFIIHSDERIHQHMPHVHVVHAENEVRFSLETLCPIDELVQPHRRDYKKRILPYLKKNQLKLRELWDKNLNDYTTPTLSENDDQFYSVS